MKIFNFYIVFCCCVRGVPQGEGCGLMNKTTKLFNIVRGMQTVMDVPLTVKMRTGVFESRSTAHKLIPQLRDLGVAMVTVSTFPW